MPVPSGWVCPFGTLQEWIGSLSRWLQRRVPFLGAGARWLKSTLAPLAWLDRPLRWGKYLMLGWIIAGTVAYGVMVFRDVDPWIALLTIAELEFGLGAIVLGVVLVASFFVERPWCRYACPLSPLIGLTGKLSLVKIQREASQCSGCGLCSKKCPMGIPVHTQSRVSNVECNMCLSCVASCPRAGALQLSLVLPGIESENPASQDSGNKGGIGSEHEEQRVAV